MMQQIKTKSFIFRLVSVEMFFAGCFEACRPKNYKLSAAAEITQSLFAALQNSGKHWGFLDKK